MSIATSLDTLRRDIPGCTLVAFGDLGTRLVLRTSSDTHCAQEQLDQICTQAAQLFSSCDLIEQVSGLSRTGPAHATVLGPGETTVLVRSEIDAADFICCICTPDHPINDIATKAAGTLRDISQDQKCSP